MGKEFPDMVFLKHEKCPVCGDKMHNPPLRHDKGVIQAVCKKDGCGFSVDLFFIGDLDSRKN